jgi:hypothetical protein
LTRPLQVYLDDVEWERLEEWAADHGWTKSQAIRAAIRALTRPKEEDPILSLSGTIQDLSPDLSDRFSEAIAETFVVAERSPKYGEQRKRGKSGPPARHTERARRVRHG